jgi:hypothetical protein
VRPRCLCLRWFSGTNPDGMRRSCLGGLAVLRWQVLLQLDHCNVNVESLENIQRLGPGRRKRSTARQSVKFHAAGRRCSWLYNVQPVQHGDFSSRASISAQVQSRPYSVRYPALAGLDEALTLFLVSVAGLASSMHDLIHHRQLALFSLWHPIRGPSLASTCTDTVLPPFHSLL